MQASQILTLMGGGEAGSCIRVKVEMQWQPAASVDEPWVFIRHKMGG